MRQIYPDLWQSERGSHFGMDMKTYFLKTLEGNILIYYSNNLAEIVDISNLGKIKYQFISHHHELTPGLYNNLRDFLPILILDQKAQKYLRKEIKETYIVTEQQTELSGLQIIHTPGHTDNNLCLYYKSPFGKNYLFLGDTIYLDNDQWNVLVMNREGGSYESLKQSLKTIQKLQVDVIMPSVAVSGSGNKAIEVTQEEWIKIIDNLIHKIS